MMIRLLLLLLFLSTPLWADRVPGTDLDMAPPQGFTAATDFPGFKSDAGAFIMVTQLPVDADKMAQSFTAERLATRGMVLKGSEEVEGRKLFLVEQTSPHTGELLQKHLLILGDKERTILVTGGYPVSGRKTLETPVKQAMLSSKVLQAVQDSFSDLGFAWEPTATLKPYHRVVNGLLFTPNGEAPPQSVFLVVAPSMAPVTSEDVAATALEALRKTRGFSEVEILRNDTLSVGGYTASEIEATTTNEEGEPVHVYQLFLMDGTHQRYLRALGQTDDDEYARWAEEFQSLARSLRMK